VLPRDDGMERWLWESDVVDVKRTGEARRDHSAGTSPERVATSRFPGPHVLELRYRWLSGVLVAQRGAVACA
jgi:hypothetical protein